MTLQEIRIRNGWSLEEASNIFGLDVETLIECETTSKHRNMWAINIILSVLQLDYKDITFAL